MTMSKWAFWMGLACLVLATVILVFADGARRWYSGVFFLVLSLAMFGNSRRWNQ
jgi:hypothetical protein